MIDITIYLYILKYSDKNLSVTKLILGTSIENEYMHILP